MNKLILSFVFTLISLGVFAQNKVPTDAAITKLMEVKKGMISVNSITDQLAQDFSTDKATAFKAEMAVFKTDMLSKSYAKFKTDYTADEIDFIYEECTSDKIDYTDLTNNFFAKWRSLKGQFFKNAKLTYRKYK